MDVLNEIKQPLYELTPEEKAIEDEWRHKWCEKHQKKIKNREKRLKWVNLRFPRRNRNQTPGYLYLLKCGDFHKIGRSVNVPRRVEDLQRANPITITIIATRYYPDVVYAENIVHHTFRMERIKAGNSKEWYYLDEDFLMLVRQYFF